MGYDRRDSGDHRAAPARTGTVEGDIVSLCSWLGGILQYVTVVRGVFPSGDDQRRASIRARSGAERTERGSFQPFLDGKNTTVNASVRRRPLSLSTRVNSLFLPPFLPPCEREGSPLPIGRTDGRTARTRQRPRGGRRPVWGEEAQRGGGRKCGRKEKNGM